MKKFKKIYIEITNICNLSCSFCLQDGLPKREMTLLEFETVLKQIGDSTDYLYLHVKGEPLMHSDLNSILLLCNKYNKKVNITTNGTLLKNNIEILKNVRQINISLHSIVDDGILKDIFEAVDELSKTVIISYRIWTENDKKHYILDQIKNQYGTLNKRLNNNIYLDFDEEFIWPDLNNEIIREKGTCFGTRSHIGILVDGTIIPCCLDSKGVLALGNIYKNSINEIIQTEKFLNMKKGFENNYLCEELCMKCNFLDDNN